MKVVRIQFPHSEMGDFGRQTIDWTVVADVEVVPDETDPGYYWADEIREVVSVTESGRPVPEREWGYASEEQLLESANSALEGYELEDLLVGESEPEEVPDGHEFAGNLAAAVERLASPEASSFGQSLAQRVPAVRREVGDRLAELKEIGRQLQYGSPYTSGLLDDAELSLSRAIQPLEALRTEAEALLESAPADVA